MPRLRVHALSMSLDGYVAGPGQDEEHPLGVGGELLHDWVFTTRTGAAMIGAADGNDGIDEDLMAEGFAGIGATIMGRNMFGPIRGEWPNDGQPGSDWKGWWGDEPPYHHRVFVMTHHERPPLEMRGTTFHFVTGGPAEALARATEAAGDLDIRLGGGAATVRQFLALGLVDSLHIAVVPELLGSGERLFENGVAATGYRVAMTAGLANVAHFFLDREP